MGLDAKQEKAKIEESVPESKTVESTPISSRKSNPHETSALGKPSLKRSDSPTELDSIGSDQSSEEPFQLSSDQSVKDKPKKSKSGKKSSQRKK
jgi:hypothetical protein